MTAGPVSGVSRRGGEVGGLPCGRNSIAGLSACPATAPGPGSGQHPARTRTRRRRRSPSREPGGRREGMARLLLRLIPVVSLVAVLISCPPHEGGRVCVMRSHTYQQPHRTAVCRGPAGCQRPAARCSGCGVVVSPQDHRRGVASAGWQASPASGFCWSPCPVFIPHAPLVLSIFLIDSRLIFLPTFA